MKRRAARWQGGRGGAVRAFALALLLALAAVAPASPDSSAANAQSSTANFEGVATCAGSTSHGRSEGNGAVVRQDEIATWQGDTRTASHARERARWHLERTAAPDDRRLEDLHVAAAITSNQTADLAEGMIGFSVDDGGDWEAPPSDDDVWTPVERGSE